MAQLATPNYGLINSLAQGLNQGLITATNLQNMKRQQQMQMLATGVQPDQNGNLQLAPWKQQQIQVEQAQNQQNLDRMNPESPAYQAIQKQDIGLLKSEGIDTTGMENQSPYQIESNPLNKQVLQAKTMAAIMAPRNNFYNTKAGVDLDTQSSGAVDKITKDPRIQQYQQRLDGLGRINGQLDDIKSGKLVDTSQLIGELQNENANLVTGSNNPAFGKVEQTQYKTAAQSLGNLIQTITANPTSINSPKIIQQIDEQVNNLGSIYRSNMHNQLQTLRRAYPHNPEAERAQDKAIAGLESNYGIQPAMVSNGSGLLRQGGQQSQDPQVAKYATQNGLDYNTALSILTKRGYKGGQ